MGFLVSRRSLIVGSVAVGASALAGGLGVLHASAEGMALLSPREVVLVEAIARVLFPPGTYAVGGGDGGTAPVVDAILADSMGKAASTGFRYLLRALDVGTILSRGVPFPSLPADEARAVLSVWASDEPFPRRLASDSFRVMVSMAFFRRPEVLEDIGWRVGCR